MRIIPEVILAELNKSGLPYKITKGTKHYHIKMDDRLVGILPKGRCTPDHRTIKNCITQIRKAARGIPWNNYQSAQQQIVR